MSNPTEEQNNSEDQLESVQAEAEAVAQSVPQPDVSSDTPPDARKRLGDRLSQARKAKELGLNEACERLRIRKGYIEALESGDWSTLPEEVYAIGFLRQYAGLLGLDVNREIEELKSGEYRLTRPFTMPDPPIAMNRTWAIAAAACFLLLLILFNVVDNGEKKQVPQIPVATPGAIVKQPLVAPNAPPAVAPQTAVPATGNVPAKPTAPTAQSPAKPAPAAKPTTAAPAPVATATPANSKAVAVAQAPKQGQAPIHPDEHVFQLKAVNEDVWLQLNDPKGGKLLKQVLLRSGQSLEVHSARDYLLLTAGNPYHLSLSIDGVPVAAAGSLGKDGKVLRDYRFQLPKKPAASSH